MAAAGRALDARPDLGGRRSGRTGASRSRSFARTYPTSLRSRSTTAAPGSGSSSSACARSGRAACCRCRASPRSSSSTSVRTSAAPTGCPGVWFFSLDASSRLAALGMRRLYHVPCFHARMLLDAVGSAGGRAAGSGWRDAECARIGERGKVFSARYRPAGGVFRAERESLEWFLTERYWLYTGNGSHRDPPRPLAAPARGGGGRARVDPAVPAAPARRSATSPRARTR